jgi:hypothetical protein
VLARVIARNARDPQGMAAALSRILVLVFEDDDDDAPLSN